MPVVCRSSRLAHCDRYDAHNRSTTPKGALLTIKSRAGNSGVIGKHIALDGPSALLFYRDRAELESQSHVFDMPVASTGMVSSVDEFDDAWLSDEDVAATLASSNVFGHSADFDTVLSSPVDIPLPALKRSRMRSLLTCGSNARDLRGVPFECMGIQPPSQSSPLFVLVPNATKRRQVVAVRERVCATNVPNRSFYLAEDTVYVPNPEFMFVLMARYLSLPGLMMLAMELCGHYRLVGAVSNAPLTSNRTLYGQRPLTSVARLQQFVSRADGFRGVKACRRALKYVADNAASPMETILYLLLCAPRYLGGYGIARPVLNARIPVNGHADSITSARHLVPDLYWPDAHLDIEYDSEEFHSDSVSLVNGRRRTLALQAMNVQVISMTYDILRDFDAFDAVAGTIMRTLGQRNARLTDELRRKRILLRNELLFRDGIYRF